jgi:hypothetical protein
MKYVLVLFYVDNLYMTVCQWDLHINNFIRHYCIQLWELVQSYKTDFDILDATIQQNASNKKVRL